MSMRFRPANISVINRRASTEAVISPAVQSLSLRPPAWDSFPKMEKLKTKTQNTGP